MLKLRALAEEHFRCKCRLQLDKQRLYITIFIFTDMTSKEFKRARRNFYRLLRRLRYEYVIKYLAIERGINEQLHAPSHAQSCIKS